MTKTERNCLNEETTPKSNTSIHDTDYSTFSDILAVIHSRFEIETNAKNKAYAFILSRGLLQDFTQFSKNEVSDNLFSDCLDTIYLSLKNK